MPSELKPLEHYLESCEIAASIEELYAVAKELEAENEKARKLLTEDETDEAVGRRVRLWSEQIKAELNVAAKAQTSAISLIGMARETGADSLSVELGGVTVNGGPIGDWVVTVKRKES